MFVSFLKHLLLSWWVMAQNNGKLKNISSDLQMERPLRILMIAPQPWFSPRGTPFSVLHRIKALSLLGHRIDLATYPIGQEIEIPGLKIHRSAGIPGVKKVKIGPSKTKIWLDLGLWRKSIQLLEQNKYDLLHTHEEAAFWGVNLSEKFYVPHLYDMHSSLPQQLSNFKYTKSRFITGIFDRLEERSILSASAVITICPELQAFVEKRFPDTKSILIENVADNSLVFPPQQANQKTLVKRFDIEHKQIVLYYGTLETYQGIELLLEAATHLPDSRKRTLRFLIAGGSEEQVKSYQKKAKDLNVSNQFIFTGFVQPQEIPSLIDLADVLVSPRLKGNNSPLKIYSYLRSQKPIVATDHVTHTQILNPSVSELTAITPQAFARGILRVLEEPEYAQELARKAARLAEKQYSYEDYLNKTKWVVQQAVRNN
jgi:glycosyltransferase involved in cell wall biosynthesis